MKKRPILFSGPMVRALLDGSKTQTRRVVKGTALDWLGQGFTPEFVADDQNMLCPYGQPGRQLWVRETWRGVVNIAPPGHYKYAVARYIPDREHCRRVEYAATQAADGEPWRPSIHMPRWASRITLEITGVRVERLQDISEADAMAEGIHHYEHSWRDSDYPLPDVAYEPVKGWPTRYSCPVQAYRALWESINGPGSWDANPWVWAVGFKRVEGGAA